MVNSLHGITINASDREELSVHIGNGYLYLKSSNINMRTIETRHDKPEGVSDAEILSDFENFFKSHNQVVISVKKKLKADTIRAIELYCGKHTTNSRKWSYENQIQKDIFDIKFDGGYIRFHPKSLFLFEGSSSASVPVVFELTSEEYENLKKLYTTF